MKPLQGGLKLEGKKEASLVSWTITRPAPPRRIRIPLEESSQVRAKPCVRVGDRVRLGEKIAEGEEKEGRDCHAPVSGKVCEIRNFPHPLLGESEAIELLSDGKDEPIPFLGSGRPQWESLPPLEVARILRESGVVTRPPVSSLSIDTLILNGCESEPYLTSDHALLMSHPLEVLKGGEILRRALGASDLILALEDNKEEAAEVLKSKIFFLDTLAFESRCSRPGTPRATRRS